MARRSPQPTLPPRPRSAPAPADDGGDGDALIAARVGEFCRKAALMLTVALVSARAYWPSEPDFKAEGGTGLDWDLAILCTVGLALAAALIGGRLRWRWSWADVGVILMATLVGMSASGASDRRTAINLAWDWGAVALAYLLFRTLPKTRGESSALAATLAAVAVAVAAYGLFQVAVELPEMRHHYLTHKGETLQKMGIAPGSPAQSLFENRLLGSNEPMSTFALTNSLAGFLVGPLVALLAIAWENLARRGGKGSRWATLALVTPPLLVVLVCLLLTKSRSAYLGLLAALAVLAWRERRRVPARVLALAGAGGLAVLAGLVALGLAAGRLDRQVLTESTKSLRYRGEYWIGAWRVITESHHSLWNGRGPGNFGGAYVRHKLPQASEEIADPHDLFLEVWATAGAGAAVALLGALGFAARDLFGPARPGPAGDDEGHDAERWPVWLVVGAGCGWVAATLLGGLNPFEGDLFIRWLLLGSAWLWGLLFLGPLWRRQPIPGAALGAGALAIAINLLAAGGIGIPAVALMLWSLIALGMNLRDDRACGRGRLLGRLPAAGLALLWAALMGIFAGAIGPHWASEAALAEADAALATRSPDYAAAADAYDRASRADKFSARPWLGLAFLKYREWQSRGARPDDLRWKAIPLALAKAVEPPRNPNSWTMHRERALVTRDLLRQLPDLRVGELLAYRANIIESTRRAARLYPTNASLRAQLAEASAEIGKLDDAATEAREALRLDDQMPHADKKLPPAVRQRLQRALPGWEKSLPH